MIKFKSLKENKEFLKILSKQKLNTEYFTVYFDKNKNNLKKKSSNYLNISFVVKKKIGNAVGRNRVKRAIREIFRQVKHQMIPATDIVVISGKEMVVESYKVIDEKLSNALLAIK